ncbi:uroporphyrinogen decarboxylase [Lentinus tigrinus ALCF2SS1-7]|uniref:Uroporphyrinogen decarboxylase n=1 Tax=Lentinus tigrinus ALCF2SS1-6 TaxID=1328759 RepID=A0A5C2SE04_9APHY|nr:uroporphyrinogen decarboxylase [Lentinus tigrinus ALCF2SS1-6]RPD74468.1 uroporphyrinogen decarboxylase [Lentinus tigrinus ALCF2SS1-7]
MSFPPLKNDLILRAARGEETERAPVWVMRQAGRYLPEFLAVRADHGFFEICRTPELAKEVTLQPIRRYTGLIDAAIIFSDILVVPQALGMEVQMNPGPHFPDPLVTPADIEKLTKDVDVDKELGYVYEAITQTRHALNGEVPLIGFCGAPWTLFSYMIEGGSTKTFQKCKTWLFKYPEESKALLDRIADVCVDFLVGQVKAGAQLLQVFDSWAGELAPHHFEEFALPSLKRIASGVREKLAAANVPAVPMTLFPKGANSQLASLVDAGYDVIGIDWCIDPADARKSVGDKVALQGNLDPMLLYGGRDAIEREVKRMCERFRGGKAPKAWICNLGHGITPGVDPEDLRWFFQCVHKYSAA